MGSGFGYFSAHSPYCGRPSSPSGPVVFLYGRRLRVSRGSGAGGASLESFVAGGRAADTFWIWVCSLTSKSRDICHTNIRRCPETRIKSLGIPGRRSSIALQWRPDKIAQQLQQCRAPISDLRVPDLAGYRGYQIPSRSLRLQSYVLGF